MNRREFSRALRAAIINRAINDRGRVACEKCGLVLGRKPYEIDHRIAEALIVDKTKPLTAADGWLLGKECCHAPKTRIDKGDIAKSYRREAKDKGFHRKAARPLMGTKASGWKQKINGGWERRT